MQFDPASAGAADAPPGPDDLPTFPTTGPQQEGEEGKGGNVVALRPSFPPSPSSGGSDALDVADEDAAAPSLPTSPPSRGPVGESVAPPATVPETAVDATSGELPDAPAVANPADASQAEPEPEAERTKGASEPRFDALEVYSPAPAVNPVVAEFKAIDLYVAERSPGIHTVECPWAHQHGDGETSHATYAEPDDRHAIGSFTCPSQHQQSAPTARHVIDWLGATVEEARWKDIIRLQAGEMNRIASAAEQVLAKAGELLPVRWTRG